MDFLDIFACIASLCCIILGIIIRYGKYNDLLFRFGILSNEQKTKISRMYQSLFLGISFLWLAGLFAFRYFDIYQYYWRYTLITISILCFSSVILSLHTSLQIEKAQKKN